MLVNLLGRSPSIFQTGELSIFDKRDWVSSPCTISWDDFKNLRRRGYRRSLSCEMSSHLTSIDVSEIPGAGIEGKARYVEHCEWLMAALCADNGKDRWVEKTPANIFAISDLQALRPDWSYIVILRDPRSVLLSLSKRGYSAAMAAARWYLPNLIAYNLLLAQRLISVRYEDLVNDVQGVLSGLGREIGVDGLVSSALDRKIDSFSLGTWQASPSEPPTKSALWTDERQVPNGYLEALELIRPSSDFIQSHRLDHVMGAEALAEKLGYYFKWSSVGKANNSSRRSVMMDYIHYAGAMAKRGYFPRPIPFYFKNEVGGR